MFNFKRRKMCLAVSMAVMSAQVLAEPCSKSLDEGGTANLQVNVSLSANLESNYRNIADALQTKYGGNVANDFGGGDLYVFVKATNVPAGVQFPFMYDGSVSIEKAFLDSYGLDTDEPDPNPCSAPGEEQSDSNASSGGGSSGGGSYGSPTLYIPEPFIADTVWNWHRDNPSGFVTATPAPGSASSFDYSSYYASQYSSFYSNYYSNYNPN